MRLKLSKGSKINGKEVQEKVQRKIIVCSAEVCPFQKTKIDDYCAICHYRKDFVITNKKIVPIIIEVADQYIVDGCHVKPELPLYQKCPIGYKEASKKCEGCARAKIKLLNSSTKEIK